MRKAITPQDLLHQWQLMHITLGAKIRAATGTEKQVLEVMDFTLDKCIKELQEVLADDGYPVEDLLTTIINQGK